MNQDSPTATPPAGVFARVLLLTAVLLLLAVARPLVAAAPDGPDLSTPRRAIAHFIYSARDGDHAAAAQALQGDGIPGYDPVRTARRFKFVLDRHIWVNFDSVPDHPSGAEGAGDSAAGPASVLGTLVRMVGLPGGTPAGRFRLGTIPLDGNDVPIEVVRLTNADGSRVWKFSRATVARVPALYQAHGIGALDGVIPEWMLDRRVGHLGLWQVIGTGVLALLGLMVLVAARAIISGVIARRAARASVAAAPAAADPPVGLAAPLASIIAVLVFRFAVQWLLRYPVVTFEAFLHLTNLLLTGLVTWLALRGSGHVFRAWEAHQQRKHDDPALRRSIATRVMVLQRIAAFTMLVLGTGLALAQIDALRAIGASMLASAGVAGIAIGLAAQRTLSNLIAGIQIAFTQPIRVGDSVVIQGEWGWVEDITLTYVTVRVWDLRRLVLPINYLLENPFQNWTIRDPHLIGTVFIHTDYRLSVDVLREELKRILEATPLWDKRVPAILAVTDFKAETVELRALCSAADAGIAWDLRCHVREQLLLFLASHEGGRYLPRTRVLLDREGSSRMKDEGQYGQPCQ